MIRLSNLEVGTVWKKQVKPGACPLAHSFSIRLAICQVLTSGALELPFFSFFFLASWPHRLY